MKNQKSIIDTVAVGFMSVKNGIIFSSLLNGLILLAVGRMVTHWIEKIMMGHIAHKTAVGLQ